MAQDSPADHGSTSKTPGKSASAAKPSVLVVLAAGTGDSAYRALQQKAGAVTIVNCTEQAQALLPSMDVDYVLLDIDQGTTADLQLVDSASRSGARVIVAGDDGTDLFCRQARSCGMSQYLKKPVSPERILAAIGLSPSHSDTDRASRQDDRGAMWKLRRSDAACMDRVVEQVSKVAPTGATVLIQGESGTGKEVVARAIHECSVRADRPMHTVNCGAINPNLIESELFGHQRGSFTGAVKDHAGVFERAEGGTLFLDEITELPLDIQVKLLRLLENLEYVRLGGERSRWADVRLICATNRDLGEAVRLGQFREDLYYRISVFPIELPPLRDRAGDIPLMANYFLDRYNEREQRDVRFSEDALSVLESYDWPGNLRELKNVVQRASIMANETIRVNDLPTTLRPERDGVVHREPSLKLSPGTSIAETERAMILATLQRCDGHKAKTARLLGVSLKTLYNRLNAYDRE